ncbi:hypothetical protein [Corallococcus llansteffanensis]|uniref:hypothetical protein n=1 Tax=Corallococcus llansteffanensis TaxID=2316731 RepID=UPI001FC913FF|nr:hypothetical protein [Corallococcus llansteffanensis]
METVTHSLEVIERQAKRMAKLVNTLLVLDVSRIHAGRLDLDLATSGTRLLVHADTPMPGVWDRSRFDQIVINLLSNVINRVSIGPDSADGVLTVQGLGCAAITPSAD